MLKKGVILTVVVINWNTKEDLIACLSSIKDELRFPLSEVLVVDNGSADGSGERVRREHSWVELLENEKNLGFAKAANIALRRMGGRYVLLLNPDTRVKERTIEKLFSFMETHREAGAAGAQLFNGDGTKQNSIANFPSLTTELLNKPVLRWLFPKRFPGKERFYAEPLEVDSVIGAAMIVRREAMERVGLLDEDFFLFLEETDWCFRMKRAGWKIYHVPEAEIYHFQGRSAEIEKKRAKVEYYRSRYHFFKKNRGGLQWLILHVGLIVRLGVELILSAAVSFFTFFTVKRWRERLSVCAYLIWWHLRGCPEGMGLSDFRGFNGHETRTRNTS
jgi:GT2 family glycosyltransferase